MLSPYFLYLPVANTGQFFYIYIEVILMLVISVISSDPCHRIIFLQN